VKQDGVRKATTSPRSEILVDASPREDLGDGDHPFLVVAPEDRPPVANAQVVQAYRADKAPDIPLRQPTQSGEDALAVAAAEARERLERDRTQLDAPARITQPAAPWRPGRGERSGPGPRMRSLPLPALPGCRAHRPRGLRPGLPPRIPGTLEQTRRRPEGGLGEFVDEAVEFDPSHGETLPLRGTSEVAISRHEAAEVDAECRPEMAARPLLSSITAVFGRRRDSAFTPGSGRANMGTDGYQRET